MKKKYMYQVEEATGEQDYQSESLSSESLS